MTKHKEQRITSYISGHKIKVYEVEQYNADTHTWYIVGNSSTSYTYLDAMVNNHNLKIKYNS